jgi:hypothetical protein
MQTGFVLTQVKILLNFEASNYRGRPLSHGLSTNISIFDHVQCINMGAYRDYHHKLLKKLFKKS